MAIPELSVAKDEESGPRRRESTHGRDKGADAGGGIPCSAVGNKTGDEFPLTFLRMQVGKTTPVAAAREAISLLGTTGLKDPTLPPVPLARGLARDRAEGGMQEPDSPRAMAREEHRGYTRVDFSKKVRVKGRAIWKFEKMEPPKIRETIDSMSKEDLTAKIQQASTMIQVLEAELEPLLAEDQEMTASKAELNYWELLTRNLDAERALRMEGETRIVPVWVREIADGTDGIEGFDREFVEFQNEEIWEAESRSECPAQTRRPFIVISSTPTSTGGSHRRNDEKDQELEKARRDTMEIQLKVYDLQRDLDDEKEKRKKDQRDHRVERQTRSATRESIPRERSQRSTITCSTKTCLRMSCPPLRSRGDDC